MKTSELGENLEMRILRVLGTLPEDEVLTQAELADRLGVLKGSGHVKLAFSKLINNRMKTRINGGDAWVYQRTDVIKKLLAGRNSESR